MSVNPKARPPVAEAAFSGANANALVERYGEVRSASERLAAPLEPEDFCLQSMPDASPVKWHLAHTTWFFETFVLEAAKGDYVPFHPKFRVLFNSYYNLVGEQHPRPRRGMLTRPTASEVYRYREHVDALMTDLLRSGDLTREQLMVVEVGLHHEQQHQELMLTDLKHGFSVNPLRPAYIDSRRPFERVVAPDMKWVSFEGGRSHV